MSRSQKKRRIAESIAIVLIAILFIACLVYAFIPQSSEEAQTTAIPSPTLSVVIPTQKPQTRRQQERSVERQIWDLLREELPETATAAIMGNLKYESRLNEHRIEHLTPEQGEAGSKYILTDRETFCKSGHGFGLAQWTGYAQHSKLWDFCESNYYDIESVEGQIAYLLYDLKDRHPMCYERLLRYQPEDLITATEDFRQSYERSIESDRDKWCRATYAQEMFTIYCKEVTDIKRIATLPFEFDIYEKVQTMNKEIEK